MAVYYLGLMIALIHGVLDNGFTMNNRIRVFQKFQLWFILMILIIVLQFRAVQGVLCLSAPWQLCA